MAQPQTKISFSITSKLLLLSSFLLIVPFVLLIVLAISLFLSDKKAYVYDSQASSAALAGREFVSYLDGSINTLKLILGSVDLSQTINAKAKSSVLFYLDNQHLLSGVELYALYKNRENESPFMMYRQVTGTSIDAAGVKSDDLKFDTQLIKEHRQELETKGHFFHNVTKTGQPPLLIVGIADPTQIKTTSIIPIAIGYFSLKTYLAGLARSTNQFTLVDNNGSVLLHSDPKEMYSIRNFKDDKIFLDAKESTFNTGTREYETPTGTRMLASYYKPGMDLIAISSVDYSKAMKATYMLTLRLVITGIGLLGFFSIIALLFSKRLSAPLKRLFQATHLVSSGNFDINLPVTSRDEIGVLTTSFISMSHQISDLIDQMVDQMRVGQELEIARTVQQSLFPPTAIENEHLLVASQYMSASECGGDWWGYFRSGSKHIFTIADATGHGFPSALITAAARSCFSVIEKLIKDGKIGTDPKELLNIANCVIYDSSQTKINMTCFVGVIDSETKTITYSSAAHNPPWLMSPKTGTKAKLSSLVAKGQRLGETRELQFEYEVRELPYQTGDTLVLYTDGLIEGKDPYEGEMYGKKNAIRSIEQITEKPPQEMLETLVSEFLNFNGDKPLDDDVTLALVRFK